MPISFSFIDTAGTASLTIYDGQPKNESAYLTKFPLSVAFSTKVEQTIVGAAALNGGETDTHQKWIGVEALMTLDAFDALMLIAKKGELARQNANNPRITFNNEYYYFYENTPRTRAIASGSEITIGSGTGGIKYYAQHNVMITGIGDPETNLQLNGQPALKVSFDIEELDFTTP